MPCGGLAPHRHVGVRAGTGHVVALLIRRAPLHAGLVAAVRAGRDVRLESDDRFDAGRVRRLVELERGEGVAVIGHRDGRHPVVRSGLGHRRDLRRPVEHRVLAVHVQVDEGVGCHAFESTFGAPTSEVGAGARAPAHVAAGQRVDDGDACTIMRHDHGTLVEVRQSPGAVAAGIASIAARPCTRSPSPSRYRSQIVVGAGVRVADTCDAIGRRRPFGRHRSCPRVRRSQRFHAAAAATIGRREVRPQHVRRWYQHGSSSPDPASARILGRTMQRSTRAAPAGPEGTPRSTPRNPTRAARSVAVESADAQSRLSCS